MSDPNIVLTCQPLKPFRSKVNVKRFFDIFVPNFVLVTESKRQWGADFDTYLYLTLFVEKGRNCCRWRPPILDQQILQQTFFSLKQFSSVAHHEWKWFDEKKIRFPCHKLSKKPQRNCLLLLLALAWDLRKKQSFGWPYNAMNHKYESDCFKSKLSMS